MLNLELVHLYITASIIGSVSGVLSIVMICLKIREKWLDSKRKKNRPIVDGIVPVSVLDKPGGWEIIYEIPKDVQFKKVALEKDKLKRENEHLKIENRMLNGLIQTKTRIEYVILIAGWFFLILYLIVRTISKH